MTSPEPWARARSPSDATTGLFARRRRGRRQSLLVASQTPKHLYTSTPHAAYGAEEDRLWRRSESRFKSAPRRSACGGERSVDIPHGAAAHRGVLPRGADGIPHGGVEEAAGHRSEKGAREDGAEELHEHGESAGRRSRAAEPEAPQQMPQVPVEAAAPAAPSKGNAATSDAIPGALPPAGFTWGGTF